ncbi:MAG: DUF1553 domain-containing protein [Bryobacteraceae bacterium]|nr:DUF1553 domain-containing protein [Bryobacteraceae bacterium]
MRLDSEAAAKADLGGGRRAVVPGDLDASHLVRRITADRPALRMPPVASNLALTPPEIETLRNWVIQGAKWEKHWSFIPPARPPLPEVKNRAWPRNGIDWFVLERLEAEGLQPSPAAGRATLLRRVSLDLTGLPPSPAEIDAFVNDPSPDAYEKAVDRLLASPRYGERMATPWLNAARYADTNGYQYDGERYMWRWRDWVIDAFNRNQPFNRFTLEQIAGDMLPGATLDQKIATGFNRNHRANTEDGIVAEEYAVEYVVDRVETTATAFLGLTLGCARCHNHKYDPFTQKEFYQVYSYFNNVPELGRAMKYGNSPPLLPAPTADQQTRRDELERRMEVHQKLLRDHQPELERAQAAWERRIREGEAVHWVPSSGLDLAVSFDGEGRVPVAPGRIGMAGVFDGNAELDAGDVLGYDIQDRFTLSAWVRSDSAPHGSVLSKMADKPDGKGYGLYLNHGKVHVHLTSNYVNDAIRVETEEVVPAGSWHHLTVTYTGSRMAEGVAVYIDGRAAPVKVLMDTLYRPFRNAGGEFKHPFRVGGGAGPERRFRGWIDDVRVYGRILQPEEISAIALGDPLNAVARKPAEQRSDIERLKLRWYFLEHAAAPEYREAWKQLVELTREKEKLERTFPTVMVMAERPVPNETHLLVRGAYDKPGEKVEPGLPAVLPPLPAGAPNNRLGFAMWLVDPSNPLTARVAVNRFWQAYFGVGLVKTTEDFGAQGEWPSHPELLDWLATEFVRTGWDVKALQKLIVTSATYRQSSRVTPELLRRDPENRLLARGPRQRLPAEMVRDQALYSAGLLAEKLGGPSVKPYQPDGLWKEIAMQDMDYVQSKAPDLYRRSLYTFWKRTIAPPLMVNFDAANHESCVVRETRTNTPLQALNLMNDVTFLEAARFVGQRMVTEGGQDRDARLRYGFRLVTGRPPAAAEAETLRNALNFHLDYFSNEAAAKTYLEQGDSPSDPSLHPRELASYAAVASLILNLDETITKE